MLLGVNPDFCEKDALLQPRVLASLGFDCADFGKFVSTDTEFFTQDDDAFFADLEKLREAYKAAGVRVWQTHGPWLYPPRDRTPEERKARFAAMAKSVRGTAALGAKYFVIHPIMPYGENVPDCPEEVLGINKDFFSRLCDVADEVGVTVCLENMPFTHHPLAHSRVIADFVREIGRESFKMCLDTGHNNFYDDAPPAEMLREHKDVIRVLHVHDNGGERDDHAPPYTGITDWDAFARALAECPDVECLSLELHNVKPESKEAEMKESILAARRLAAATGR